jgi:hypothetical protein
MLSYVLTRVLTLPAVLAALTYALLGRLLPLAIMSRLIKIYALVAATALRFAQPVLLRTHFRRLTH